MNQFEVPLSPFFAQLDESVAILDYLSVSVRVRATLGSALAWDVINDRTKQLARKFMSFGGLDTYVVLCGLFTATIAAFEEYLRSTLKIAFSIKAEGVGAFKDLGESVANRHFKSSGQILIRVHDQPEYLHVDLYEMARRLGTCLPDSNSFELNKNALANLPNLTKLTEFIECLRDFGFDITVDRIAKLKAVQSTLGTRGTRNTSKELTKVINEAVKLRNRLAHTGAVSADVTDQSLREIIEVLRNVVNGIFECLQTQGDS